MFAQVIRGRVSDVEAARAARDRWLQELAPGATGWLGSTTGVTEDGQFISIARFEDEQAARRNSERPEQDKWWAETATIFTGEVTFSDSNDVLLDLVGNPDDAGFVQIMQGRESDPARSKQLMTDNSALWAEFRPEILGTVVVTHADGLYTAALYFTNEQDARDGENKEPPPELQALMTEMNALALGPPDFFDLREPWLDSPAS